MLQPLGLPRACCKTERDAIIAPMKTSPLVPADLREAIEPLPPKHPAKPKGGRPRVPDRAALGGIVSVLRTGCPWRFLPEELGCGSGWTCWRRLRDWQGARVWERLHERLLNWLGDEAAIDRSRASTDSVSVRAKRGAKPPAAIPRTAANPARRTAASSTGTASRWRYACPPPAPTTRPSYCRLWTPSLRSSVPGGDRVVRGSVRPSSTPPRPTTIPSCGGPFALVGWPRGSPAGASTPANGSAGTAGWSSAASPGCWAADASMRGASGGPTCSGGCCTRPAP